MSRRSPVSGRSSKSRTDGPLSPGLGVLSKGGRRGGRGGFSVPTGSGPLSLELDRDGVPWI